jgi:hypothetical protein
MTSDSFRPFLRLFALVVFAITIVAAGTIIAQPEAAECRVPTVGYGTIENALADPACTTIVLAEGRFKENLVIDRSLSIEGAGAGESVIDGQLSDRVVHIMEDAVVSLSDVSIARGQSGLGGGILNEGDLTLNRVAVRKNIASIDGGGLHNVGRATIYDSSFCFNKAVDFSGGGLRNEGRMYLNNSTVCLNTADFSGGGISNEDEGRLWIYSSTITNNRGGVGGGIAGNEQGGGIVRIKNTLVGDNYHVTSDQPSDCARTINSLGYNQVVDLNSCNFTPSSGDILGRPAFLGKREGVPSYYPLTSLSPAINSGDPGGCVDYKGDPLAADQRGVAREGRCDIGAIEFDGEFNRSFLPVTLNTGCADFFDDFSDPRSGWPVVDNELVLSEYLNGEYRIFTRNPDLFYLFLSPACPRDFYTVEVDARWEGEPGAIYGILFASAEDFEEYYFFFINTEFLVYRIMRTDETGTSEIAPLTDSSAIQPGNATNRLEIQWESGLLKAFVNGTKLGEWPVTDQLRPSFAGVFAGSYIDQQNSDARFDNFSVVTLETASGANLRDAAQVVPSDKVPYAAVDVFSRAKRDLR